MTGPAFLALPDGTAWPNPSAVADLQWRLRYTGQTTRQDSVFAATACTAYQELIWLPRRRRETAVRLIRAATPSWDEEHPSEPPASLDLPAALEAVLAELETEVNEGPSVYEHQAGHRSGVLMAVYRIRETLAGRVPTGGE